IAQWLSERLGQQFVIENRPGAGGNVGTEAVVRAAPDGYTLGLFGASSAINATLYDKLNFNFVRDIAPIAPIVRFPYIMVVNPSVPPKTLPEFIAYAKANPGKINMASVGIGSTTHVNGELFKPAPRSDGFPRRRSWWRRPAWRSSWSSTSGPCRRCGGGNAGRAGVSSAGAVGPPETRCTGILNWDGAVAARTASRPTASGILFGIECDIARASLAVSVFAAS